MNDRERIIRLWFSMWLEQKDLGIDDIFPEDVVYVESWGNYNPYQNSAAPQFRGGKALWF